MTGTECMNDLIEQVAPLNKTTDKLGKTGRTLLAYLQQKEETEILLLDMLRAKEMSQGDYDKLIKQGQIAYKSFLGKLVPDDQEIAKQ